MKQLTTVALIILGLTGIAQADTASVYVATVLGNNAYEVQNGGSQVYFKPQPDTEYVWMENNGQAPDVVATYTYGGVTANRDGMKTFACTDIAYGERLDSISMEFDYYSGTDPETGNLYNMINPGINFFITDGSGHYGIWSPGSGGTPYTTTDIVGEPGWKHLTLDCTSLSENTWGQMNEYNPGSGLSSNKPYWSEIRDWTIAGFYDYQRTPQGGFEARDDIWSDITNVGVADTTLNAYGIVLFHGDTVGGMYGDGNGEIGADAERPWSQAGRMARNYELAIDGTSYNMVFIPEPATIGLLAFGGLMFLRKGRKQNS